MQQPLAKLLHLVLAAGLGDRVGECLGQLVQEARVLADVEAENVTGQAPVAQGAQERMLELALPDRAAGLAQSIGERRRVLHHGRKSLVNAAPYSGSWLTWAPLASFRCPELTMKCG